MAKTIAFVTNQFSCDRIIYSARVVADETQSDLVVVAVLNCEYALNPEVIDYLFTTSKKNNAVMRLFFSEDTLLVLRDSISEFDCSHVVTGMPSRADSVLYTLWKDFADKTFYTVDSNGELLDVASSHRCSV